MKKYLALCLSAVMLCGAFTACGKTDDQKAPERGAEAAVEKVENKTAYTDFTAQYDALKDGYIKVKDAYEDASVEANKTVEEALSKAAALLNETDGMTEEMYDKTPMDEKVAAMADAVKTLDDAYAIMHPEAADTGAETVAATTAQ